MKSSLSSQSRKKINRLLSFLPEWPESASIIDGEIRVSYCISSRLREERDGNGMQEIADGRDHCVNNQQFVRTQQHDNV